ncbi:hypothetical protein, partial [Streptomyces sp. 8N706]|uniref:hypothetical protein n=1 Tax=Streptomyces sp. 8N706 TaxID=3457416 RepID=UPI003FD685C3
SPRGRARPLGEAPPLPERNGPMLLGAGGQVVPGALQVSGPIGSLTERRAGVRGVRTGAIAARNL